MLKLLNKYKTLSFDLSLKTCWIFKPNPWTFRRPRQKVQQGTQKCELPQTHRGYFLGAWGQDAPRTHTHTPARTYGLCNWLINRYWHIIGWLYVWIIKNNYDLAILLMWILFVKVHIVLVAISTIMLLWTFFATTWIILQMQSNPLFQY